MPDRLKPRSAPLPVQSLHPSAFSLEIYGDPAFEADLDGLAASIRRSGVLVPLVVAREGDGWEILSGHRRHACALAIGLDEVPCQVVRIASSEERRRAVIDYNRQRRKTFRQMMREADALHNLLAADARRRQWDNLAQNAEAEGRKPDARRGRTDATVAEAIGLGGKDLYRQARAFVESGRNRGRAGHRGRRGR